MKKEIQYNIGDEVEINYDIVKGNLILNKLDLKILDNMKEFFKDKPKKIITKKYQKNVLTKDKYFRYDVNAMYVLYADELVLVKRK